MMGKNKYYWAPIDSSKKPYVKQLAPRIRDAGTVYQLRKARLCLPDKKHLVFLTYDAALQQMTLQIGDLVSFPYDGDDACIPTPRNYTHQEKAAVAQKQRENRNYFRKDAVKHLAAQGLEYLVLHDANADRIPEKQLFLQDMHLYIARHFVDEA